MTSALLSSTEYRISLSDAHAAERMRASMQENGFAILMDAYNDSETEALRRSLELHESRLTPAEPAARFHNGHLTGIWNLFEVAPDLMRLTVAPNPMRFVAEILGEPAELFRSTLMKRAPGSEVKVQWHQDYALTVDRRLGGPDDRGLRAGVPHYWAQEEVLARTVNSRFHVDAQYEDNGCLRVVAGSHKWKRRPHEEVLRRALESEAVACPAPAGSILFYHPLLAHSSQPNRRADDGRNHRRVVHLEWRAASLRPHPELDWYRWKHTARIQKDGVFFPIARG